ncbi:hypothetical protein HCG51_08520 [Tolypothrix sp. PCC 7910]|uniref:hypothetical protein n=1 Tax=Tolypothrix sp. PCC 7910 TaxID=2099387 RepID=UPI001427903E|nr:hypothetical protein [Tolypothrix sp. PCC 7910]QIR36783.1 hypothetical protein HCG51_08520 [Tolypothrix sp. PCC 7910]
MNVLELLKLKQLRFEVASHLVLQEWQPEDLTIPKCPKCDRKGSATSYQSQGNRVCYCIGCNYYFKEIPPSRTCQCTVPGHDKGCQGCPNFEEFMEHIDKQLVKIEHLNFEQLQGLLPQNHY